MKIPNNMLKFSLNYQAVVMSALCRSSVPGGDLSLSIDG